MKSTWQAGLLAGVSMTIALGASAQDANQEVVQTAAAETREMDKIVVIGTGQTYSSSESTESMALLQAPITSALAVIDNLPGVSVNEGDTFGFDDWSTTIALRGFQTNLGEQQVGITIDGLPNGNSNYGGGAKANRYIDTQNLGGVEVSQGTADIASRSNEALGGTLNFITQDALDEERVRLSASFGDDDAQRFYGRYDTGLMLNGTTKAWVSLSTQEATDWINGSAENTRDHFAAKVQSDLAGVNWTSYFSFDDIHEDNYQRLFTRADYEATPEWDQLTAEWTGVPHIDQLYRKGWSTMRKNSFLYLKADKEIVDGLKLEGSVYRHDNSGRGDWVPPYIVDVTADGAGNPESELSGGKVIGGPFLGQIFYVDAGGVALSMSAECAAAVANETFVTSLPFPYGGASAAADPACYPTNAIPVQSYRHTHYQKNRTGVTGDITWEADFGAVENTVRAGLWYEDQTRDEYRDWHKIIDTRVGFYYDDTAYWQQYARSFPQTTFKWYVQDTVAVGDFAFNLGLKQFNNELERKNQHAPTDPTENYKISSDSDVLLSGGASWTPAAVEGLEVFAGYAENYKSLSDGLIENIGADGLVPDAETSENYEVGVRYTGDRMRGSVVYFDTTFDNRLLFVSAESVAGIDYLEATNGGYVNAGGIESNGFEVAGEFDATDILSLYASYTYNDSTILGTGNTILDDEAGITPGARVPGIPENMAVVSANVEKGAYFGGLSVKYVDVRYIDAANTFKAGDHYESDLFVGVRGEAISEDLSNLDLRLTVNNLFDDRYLGGISGGGAWIAAPRTVALTVTADF